MVLTGKVSSWRKRQILAVKDNIEERARHFDERQKEEDQEERSTRGQTIIEVGEPRKETGIVGQTKIWRAQMTEDTT